MTGMVVRKSYEGRDFIFISYLSELCASLSFVKILKRKRAKQDKNTLYLLQNRKETPYSVILGHFGL